MSEKEASTFTSWVSRPVFLSSTFKDMQAERDHLNKVVFPELAERLRARHVLLEPIDLRQGVEVANEIDIEARELLTLKVCLDEIDKSRPLLIVLLGDRYGWTPPKQRLEAAANEKGFQFEVEGKSVTALEIEYGLIKKDPWLRTNSLFLFRKPLPYARMPKEKAEDYSEEYSKEVNASEKAKNLKALKQKIMDDPVLCKQVRPYTLEWDEQTEHITETSLKDWGVWVQGEIWKILDEETKDIEQKVPKSWEEEERQAIEDFVQDRSRNFVGREDILSELRTFAYSEAKEGADWGACITAGPGTGKSALFAKLYREFEQDESILHLSHAAGITPQSGDVDSMLLRWITELSSFLEITNPLSEKYTEEDLDNTFASLLSRSSVKKRVVVLIDALNQFNPTTRGLHMTWLKRPWPLNARIIATAIEGEAADGLAQWAGVLEFELEGLTEKNAVEIITAIYERYHRKVSFGAKSIILTKLDFKEEKAFMNPLWLSLALEQLNLLDEDDYSLANKAGYDPSEHLANNVPGDVSALYEWILTRLEKTYGTEWVASIVSLVAVSRQGWREMDFETMLPNAAKVLFSDSLSIVWDPLKFAVIRRGLRGQLIQSGSSGRWKFMHQQMQEAAVYHIQKVLNLIQSDTEMNKALHSLICDHLLRLKSDDPIHVSETMWHLIAADDKKRAAEYLSGSQPEQSNDASLKTLLDYLLSGETCSDNLSLYWVCELLDQKLKSEDMYYNLYKLFLQDLDDVLNHTGRFKIREVILESVLRELIQMKKAQDSTKRQRFSAVVYDRLGKIHWALGYTNKALNDCKESEKLRSELVASNPNENKFLFELSVSYQNIGDIYEYQNNLKDALKEHQKGLMIAKQLAKSESDSLQYKSDLCISFNRVGKCFLRQEKLQKSLQEFQEGLSIAKTLFDLDPKNIEYKKNLAISHQFVGIVFRKEGNLPAALTEYQEFIEIIRDITEIEPDNLVVQCDLSDWLQNIGEIYLQQGKHARAHEDYELSLKIMIRLTDSEPDNTTWQKRLCISYEKLGDVLRAEGKLRQAQNKYQAGIKIYENLLKYDIKNADWQRGLSVLYMKIGGIHQELGRSSLSEALEIYHECMKIRDNLVTSFPDNPNSLYDLALIHGRLGEIFLEKGNLTDSLSELKIAKKIIKKLIIFSKRNTEYQRDLSVFYEITSEIYESQNKVSYALNHKKAALRIIEKLVKRDSSNAEWQRDLWIYLYKIAQFKRKHNMNDYLDDYLKVAGIIHDMKKMEMSFSPKDIQEYRKIIELLNSNGYSYKEQL